MKHEASCTCPMCVAYRTAMRQNADPLMQKKIRPIRVIIPVDQAIAQVQEAIDCYEGKLHQLYAEMKILKDEA